MDVMDLLSLVLSRGVLVVGFPGLHPDGDGAALAAVPGESEYGQAAFVYAGLVGRYGYRGGVGRLGVGRQRLEGVSGHGQTQDHGYCQEQKPSCCVVADHSWGPSTATRVNSRKRLPADHRSACCCSSCSELVLYLSKMLFDPSVVFDYERFDCAREA